MDFEAIIGLEIHIELKTRSKMFSSSANIFGEKPNSHVAPLDIALPGALPVVNKQAVINAIKVCHALNMNIDDELWFDRKNYFYSDLAKGYQITQYYRPLGKNGYINIKVDGMEKTIHLSRLHLEEDTCKQIHLKNETLLDYNRSGIPLIEIVSLPELSNGKEAMKYVKKIRSIVTFLDVSNGKMEQGSIRCDVNISIRNKGDKEFGKKVEIKNINTLTNIQRAIDYEINRQIEVIKSGHEVIQETRRYDEDKKKTVVMRLKTDSIDYKYFIDPNIVPIKLSKEFIESAINSSSELAEEKYERYLKLGLNEYDASLIVAKKENALYFDELIKLNANPKLAANWLTTSIFSYLKKNDIEITDFKVEPKRMAQLLKLIEERKISNKQGKEIFVKIIDSGSNPIDVINELGYDLIQDEIELAKIVNQILEENPQVINDYHNGKDKAIRFIVGQVMKVTSGKADPKLTNQIILEELKRR